MFLVKQVAIFILITTCVESANILGIFPMAGLSHYSLNSQLMKGLIRAGHNVTMVSPYEMKKVPQGGNYKDVVLDGFAEEFQKIFETLNLFKNSKQSIFEKTMNVRAFINITNNTLLHPQMKKLLQSEEKFDLVVLEYFFNEALQIYGRLFDAPVIILHSMEPNFYINHIVGNTSPLSYISHYFTSDFDYTSFLDRAYNVYVNLVEQAVSIFYLHVLQDKVLHESYPNSPPVHELYKDVSIILCNSHTSMVNAQPLVPNLIEIGGYFIDPPQKLPKDLQEFMDDAPHGVVYMSMGSNLNSKDMTNEKKQHLLKVFEKLKQKVVWKFEDDLPEKPNNVLIRKWVPQNDLLAHPNIKLFITHGGMLSNIEAIYHGVPLLVIPVFADQPANAARAVNDGYSLKIPYYDDNFNEETISALVNELLTNPKYSEIAKHKSKLYHDRPMKPMETAVYWVEYVIRHKGAGHLRVKGADMPWYQYYLVDVLGSLVFIVISFYVVGRTLLARIIGIGLNKKHKTQ